MENILVLHVSYESDEDSEPLALENAKRVVLGCFDGLGGSSMYKCRKIGSSEDFIPASHYASRLYKDSIGDFLEGNSTLISSDLITKQFESALAEIPQLFEEKPTIIKSKLAKRFASTCALLQLELYDDKCKATSYWSGDSRVYKLSPKDGLVQLSKDDIHGGLDPYQNRVGGQMERYLSADDPIEITEFGFDESSDPALFFTCSDGCFDIFNTPMHFEHFLLSMLVSCSSIDMLKDKLHSYYSEYKADDVSLAMYFWGFTEYSDLEKAFKRRLKTFGKTYWQNLDIKEKVRNSFDEKYTESKFGKGAFKNLTISNHIKNQIKDLGFVLKENVDIQTEMYNNFKEALVETVLNVSEPKSEEPTVKMDEVWSNYRVNYYKHFA